MQCDAKGFALHVMMERGGALTGPLPGVEKSGER